MTEISPRSKSAAERQARHRRRQRDGVRVAMCEVPDELRDYLIDRGFLTNWDEADGWEIGAALVQLASEVWRQP